MAFPTVLSVTESTQDGSSTSITVNYPASSSGDLLLSVIVGTYNRTPDNPSGYTSILGETYTRVAAKVSAGESSGSFSVQYADTTGAACAAYVYLIQAGTWANSGTLTNDIKASSDLSADPPNLSPGWTLDTLWVIGTSGADFTGAPGAPANYGNLDTYRTGFANMATARRELNAASENPGAFTNMGLPGRSVTVAVKPAGGGTAVKDLIGGFGIVAFAR